MSSPPHRRVCGERVWLRAVAIIGFCLAAQACSGPPPTTFDLASTAAAAPIGKVHPRRQLAVDTPSAVGPIGSDSIIVRRADGSLATLARARWSDQLPRLLQGRIVQAFEAAGAIGRVAPSGTAATPDVTLDVEIHTFEIDVGAGQSHIELAAKLVSTTTGRTLAGRLFQASAPSTETGPAAASSLQTALSELLPQLVKWAGPYM